MSKKTVLITGTNPGGIGNSLARAFQSQGLQVYATARNTKDITDLSGLGIITLPLEITNDTSIQTLFDTIDAKTKGQGLDILVNNAGRNYTIPALDMDINEARAMFEVNVFGVMRMCQVFAPLLIKAQGTIVQIGSCAGVIPYVFGSSYNASKAALHSYTDALRLELEPLGVKVTTVVTGGVKSRIARVDRVLPETSLYKGIESDYNRRQKHSQEVGVENRIFAQRVVRQILGPKGGPARRIWEGNMSWVVWFANHFLPYRWMELIIMRMFKVWKLKNTTSSSKS